MKPYADYPYALPVVFPCRVPSQKAHPILIRMPCTFAITKLVVFETFWPHIVVNDLSIQNGDSSRNVKKSLDEGFVLHEKHHTLSAGIPSPLLLEPGSFLRVWLYNNSCAPVGGEGMTFGFVAGVRS